MATGSAKQLPTDLSAAAISEPEIEENGRISIDANSNLVSVLSAFVESPPLETTDEQPPPYTEHARPNLKLNIVIQVVGSRGDVQPFVALGTELQKCGHRVRLATHNVFDSFVRDAGLEFFPIGGDPAELMAYMVKNPGLIPNLKSLREKEVQRKRKMVAEMLEGCWKACIEPDPVTGSPFVADAIIANPPSFAHIHCAEALSVPLHLMFTMPWSPTRAFPHPLANMNYSSTDPKMANYISYLLVDFMTWQGLGDVINAWRRRTLELEAVPLSEGWLLAQTLKIPFTYCWSPALVPKPEDWGQQIDICGFFFREAPNYTPPPDLDVFLKAGPPPIYIGFGSIVVDNPEQLVDTVLEAVARTGVRAIVSRGWSKLAGREDNSNVYYIGDCPHEWLFQHVAAVVHHGGAGTTAAGLRYGRPTTIVPFFGDQPFWGGMVAAAGAGPEPIMYKSLDAKTLADAIKFCLKPSAALAAKGIAEKMSTESGVKAAVRSFHANLPLEIMQCDLIPDQTAAWVYSEGSKNFKLSRAAVGVLTQHEIVQPKRLALYEVKKIIIENRRWDPITAFTSSSLATTTNILDATANIFVRPYQALQEGLKRDGSSTPESMETPSSMGQESLKTDQSSNLEAIEMPPGPSRPEMDASNTPAATTNLKIDDDNGTVKSVENTEEDILPVKGKLRKRNPYRTMSAPSSLSGATTLSIQPSSSATSTKSMTMTALTTATSVSEAGARGLGRALTTYTKGALIDIPVAVTEGLRCVPHLYGDEPFAVGPVTGIGSGLVAGGKAFVVGMSEGLTDLVVLPMKALGEGKPGMAAAGLGKGTLHLATKTGAGALGLVVYPLQGVGKTIRGAYMVSVRRKIREQKMAEGEWMVGMEGRGVDADALVARFHSLAKARWPLNFV